MNPKVLPFGEKGGSGVGLITLPETKKETHLPTINFQVLLLLVSGTVILL